jgi:hypothetical protein
MKTLYDIKQLAYRESLSGIVKRTYSTLNYDKYKNSFTYSIRDNAHLLVKGRYWAVTNKFYEGIRNYK